MNELQNVRVRQVNEHSEGSGPRLPLSDAGAPGRVKRAVEHSVGRGFEEGMVTDHDGQQIRHWSWFRF